jgi:hypothetical protein
MTRATRLAAAALIAACGSAALAAPLSETFTYQGRLDDGGAPADGLYDFQFRLFDAASGGAIVGNPLTYSNVQVSDGLFTRAVNFGGIGLLFQGDRRWLEVRVREAGSGGYTILGPRQEITASPYSSYALNAEFAADAAYADASGTTLDAAYDNGRTIIADSGPLVLDAPSGSASLQLGDGGARGLLNVFNPADVRNIEISTLNSGGYAQGYAATGDTIWFAGPDTSLGGGGLFNVYRRNGSGTGSSIGFEVNGNWGGTENTRVIVRGDSQVFEFATDVTGDNSMRIPADAVNATEMFNEPGVASAINSGNVALTPVNSTIDTALSRTINCPTNGYVLVIATCEATINHASGTTSSVNIGVSDTAGSFPVNQDVEVRIDDSDSSGGYDFPVTVHGLFSVGAGARTFYLLGDLNNTNISAGLNDSQLTCVFIPTSYGSVTPTLLAPPDMDSDLNAPTQFGMTRGEIEDEQARSIMANEMRIQSELESMRRLVDELSTRVHALEDDH